MDKFQELRTIGRGSFGKAVLCKRLIDEGFVVIKVVEFEDINEKERQEAMNEVHVISSLDNPYIVKYFESFEENKALHVVMEYLKGGDLDSLIQKKVSSRPLRLFPETKIIRWFLQLSKALKHMHEKGILHRDLKSSNIFLNEDSSVVKIGDFGIAKMLSAETRFAVTAIGTPYYLSPEICNEQPYNEKSDIWSLGCVIYEMCALKHAFDGKSLPALVVKILKSECAPLPRVFSSALRQLISSMLNRDPRLRPSASRLVSQLESLPCITYSASSSPNIQFKPPRETESCPATPRETRVNSPISESSSSLPQTLLPFKVHRKAPLADHMEKHSKIKSNSQQQTSTRTPPPLPRSPQILETGSVVFEPISPLVATPPTQNHQQQQKKPNKKKTSPKRGSKSEVSSPTQQMSPQLLPPPPQQQHPIKSTTKGRRLSQESIIDREEEYLKKLRTVKARVSLSDPPFVPRFQQEQRQEEEEEVNEAPSTTELKQKQQPLQQAAQTQNDIKPTEEHLRRALENLQNLDNILKSFVSTTSNSTTSTTTSPREKKPIIHATEESIEALREQLEMELGEEVFRRAYSFLRQREGDQEAEKMVSELFGTETVTLLSELIQMEDSVE